MATGTSTAPTGAKVLQLAQQHVNEKYVLGVLVPKNNSDWKGPWDCAEFVSWVIFQTLGKLYGCHNNLGNPATENAFTGYWDRDAKTLCQTIQIDDAAGTPGAAVLRIPQIGAMGHIVISDGAGGTVEAHSSKDGVIKDTLAYRRWDKGILAPGIEYPPSFAIPVPPPITSIYRLTTPLMTGAKVGQIQQKLKQAGFDPGPLDNEFGPHTHAAVLAFQLSNGLLPDGEVGDRTAHVLGV